MKEATLYIDLDSILYNYRHLKCYYNKKVIAVLKDNAYGIGLLEVYKTLKDESDLIIALSSLIEVEKIKNLLERFNCFDFWYSMYLTVILNNRITFNMTVTFIISIYFSLIVIVPFLSFKE